MKNVYLVATLVFTVLRTVANGVTTETVYEAIGRHPDLIKFQDLVNRDEVLRKLLQHWAVTVFAPTEEAITAKAQWLLGREGKVATYHVINMLANTTLFPFKSSSSGLPPLYMTVKESSDHPSRKEYFVNNAKILRSESYISRDGFQQILYVIDELLQPYSSGSTLPPTALDLLHNPGMHDVPEILSGFSRRVKDENVEDIFNREGNHTFFIPVGSRTWDGPESQQKVDEWVIRGHVIPRHAVFTRLAGTESYHSAAFRDAIKVGLSFVREINDVGNYTMYAQSNTMRSEYGHKEGAVLSRILKANIPVRNGVVHLIEHPLMIIDTTVWRFLTDERHTMLTEFLELVESSQEVKELLMSSQQKTLLVPSNEAIRHLPEDTMEMIRSNLTAFLKLHLIMHPISSNDVLYERVKEWTASDERSQIHFRIHEYPHNKTLVVEGGNVKAEAVQPDIGAVDGMVHIIDRFLGIPYQTAFQKLQSDPHLRITYNLSEQDDWGRNMLDDHTLSKNYTFFAPSDEAWAKIQEEMPSAYLKLTMQTFSYHAHKILDRHLIVGKLISFEELHKLNELQMVHGNFKVHRTSTYDDIFDEVDKDESITLEWNGVSARIIRPDIHAVNGVIHVIDNVMMKKRDLTIGSGQDQGTKSNIYNMFGITAMTLCISFSLI